MQSFVRSLLFLGLCAGCLKASPQTAVAGTPPGLFDSEEPLAITLTGDLRTLLQDRADNSSYHPIQVVFSGSDGQARTLSIQAKTRGHFRKSKDNCVYPPLLLNFGKPGSTGPGLFEKQSKTKLVMPCQGDDYVVREWLVYKLYNLVSPQSFRARLVKVTLLDTKKPKNGAPFYAMLLEEENQMATRNQKLLIERKLLRPENTETQTFLTMALFEFMIGNTDWSVQYLQNIKLLFKDSLSIPEVVPYDFDHAGIVNTPYALPAEELQMSSVRERRFRGFCLGNLSRLDPSVALFRSLKEKFYAVYTGCALLDPKYIKNTTEYLDAFYKTLDNPRDFKQAFSYPCDPSGTGNVVIKGLGKE